MLERGNGAGHVDGASFGPYQLLDLIGRGGMGEVHRAYDSMTNRVVALKLLPHHLADDERFQQRFAREARIAAGLNEPHVVPIHRYGEIDGRLYVDMRLIEGIDLQQLIAQGPIAPARVAYIVEQVAAALEAAHRGGLVHRDVKPSNILLTDRDFAYLIDFGIASALDETSITGTGQAMGSIAYMAPERFQTGQIDGRADVYALTCVLYECLTGQKVFAGNSPGEQLAAHMLNPPPRPSEHGLPPAFDHVIAMGMAKDPAARFQTPDALAHAVRAAADLSGPLALTMPQATQPWMPAQPPPPINPEIRPRPRSKRRRAVLAAVAAVVVVAAASVFAVTRHGVAPAEGAEASTIALPKPVDIDRLLLGATEINTILDRQDMVVAGRMDSFADDDGSTQVSPAECDGAAHIAAKVTYQTSDFQQMRTMWVYGVPSNGYLPVTSEAVFQFPSQEAAQTLFDKMAQIWQSCLDRDIVVTDQYSGDTNTGRLVDVIRDDRLLTANVTYKEVPQGFSCQRALARESVFVADVRVCGSGITDPAHTVAARIADKIPDGANAAPPVQSLPETMPMLLDADALSALADRELKVRNAVYGLSAPWPPESAVEPAACSTLATIGLASTYSDITWSAARRREFTPVEQSQTSPLTADESIVLAASPAVAAKFLEDSTAQWQRCLNSIFHFGTKAIAEFVIRDVKALPGRVVSQSVQRTDARFNCSHVLAVKGAFIVETHSCGGPSIDVEAMADRILAKVPG